MITHTHRVTVLSTVITVSIKFYAQWADEAEADFEIPVAPIESRKRAQFRNHYRYMTRQDFCIHFHDLDRDRHDTGKVTHIHHPW